VKYLERDLDLELPLLLDEPLLELLLREFFLIDEYKMIDKLFIGVFFLHFECKLNQNVYIFHIHNRFKTYLTKIQSILLNLADKVTFLVIISPLIYFNSSYATTPLF